MADPAISADLVDGRWPLARCRAPDCPARVVWALTERGGRTLVDADPAPGGNLLLVGGRGASAPTAVRQPPHLAFGRTDLHKSHFATCTRPRAFRRSR